MEAGISCKSPLLLCSEPGFDASSRVDALAQEARHPCTSVSMGSAEGYKAAESAISEAAKSGRWVLLRNVHLCPSWLVALEKRLHGLKPHAAFRLFLTSEIHPQLPVRAVLCSVLMMLVPMRSVSCFLGVWSGVRLLPR